MGYTLTKAMPGILLQVQQAIVYERQEQTRIQDWQWHSPLWLWWTLANALGGALVGALEEGGFQFFATLVLTGPVIGVAQWLVLRRYIRATGWWVVVSSVGWWSGINLRILLGEILNRLVQSLWHEFGLWEVFWINTVQEPVTLVSLGFFQWLLLRRRLPCVGWWILASAVGGAIKGSVSASVCAVACQPVAASVRNGQVGAMAAAALSYGAGWAGYSVVTGLVLVWLLWQRYRP